MTLKLSISTGDQQKYRLQSHHINIIRTAKYTCEYCGFQSIPSNAKDPDTHESQGYMQVHSESYSLDPKAPDQKCVCPFCYQTLNLSSVEIPEFIYFPWATQEQINHLMIVICSAIQIGLEDNLLSAQATKTYLQFLNYKNYIGQFSPQLGEDPAKLVQVLYWLSKEDKDTYNRRNVALKGVRYIAHEPAKCLTMHFAYWNTHKWYRTNIKEHWQKIHSEIINQVP